jgi:hypothetical protein
MLSCLGYHHTWENAHIVSPRLHGIWSAECSKLVILPSMICCLSYYRKWEKCTDIFPWLTWLMHFNIEKSMPKYYCEKMEGSSHKCGPKQSTDRGNTERDTVLAVDAVQLCHGQGPIAVWARWAGLLFLARCQQLRAWFAHHGFYLLGVLWVHLRAIFWSHQHGSIAESRCLQPSTTALDHCWSQDGHDICDDRNILFVTTDTVLMIESESTEWLIGWLTDVYKKKSKVKLSP